MERAVIVFIDTIFHFLNWGIYAGFAFGFLTFGLFLGFLPTYLGVELPVDDRILGAVGSLLSLVILWFCVRRYHKFLFRQ